MEWKRIGQNAEGGVAENPGYLIKCRKRSNFILAQPLVDTQAPMLHLAQIQVKDPSNQVVLRLLAHQTPEAVWVVLPDTSAPSMIQIQDRPDLREGMLVLVQLLPSGELLRIDDAVDWILELIQTYLSQGVTPDFLQQEAERVEEWRQTLTLQSQELGQQRLEIEARREQIQALEADLKRERQHLEALAKHSGNISQEP
jgi:hypothetical protein